MLNLANTLLLLSVPVLWMGVVQLCFGLLSRWVFDDGLMLIFAESALPMILVALAMLLIVWKRRLKTVSYRDALLFATLTWVVTGVLGGLPIMLIAQVSFTDAVFESISALTTTGASILIGLDSMSPSFLLYRQFLQWMGGLGVVIFVVAVLPMLNVGGMRLLRAETPGPVKDDKLTPRIAHTSHYLWLVYVLITVSCVLAYYMGGMTFYDALAHSFSTGFNRGIFDA
jgi:Trk-type K+ transport systems, membrane components